MDRPKDIPTEQGDVIISQDDDSGITYVFRGRKTYQLVDGKEVLVENKVDEQKCKIPSNRPRE